MTGLPDMPPGWRPTTNIRPVPSDQPGAGWSTTHRERLWLYDPTGEGDLVEIALDPANQQWALEPVFDGLSPCCP